MLFFVIEKKILFKQNLQLDKSGAIVVYKTRQVSSSSSCYNNIIIFHTSKYFTYITKSKMVLLLTVMLLLKYRRNPQKHGFCTYIKAKKDLSYYSKLTLHEINANLENSR